MPAPATVAPGLRRAGSCGAIWPPSRAKSKDVWCVPCKDAQTVGTEERVVRVGGQALPDGVLMRTDRVWAIARRDGTVCTGDLPATRCRRVPVLRVLTALGPALLVGLRGGRGRAESRRVPWPLVRGLIVAQIVVVTGDWIAGRARLGEGWAPLVALAGLVLALGAFRVATPGAQWRYHGAEHKAVAAHERGIDLCDVDAVLLCDRVHPRCGTNLIVWLVVGAVWLGHLPLLPQATATVLSIAVIAEVLAFAARYPASWPTRALQAPGALLQWVLTTSEPTVAEQLVGCQALAACLARHTMVVGLQVVASSPL
jgi:uncharacterized protein YqhQ